MLLAFSLAISICIHLVIVGPMGSEVLSKIDLDCMTLLFTVDSDVFPTISPTKFRYDVPTVPWTVHEIVQQLGGALSEGLIYQRAPSCESRLKHVENSTGTVNTYLGRRRKYSQRH